MRTLSSKGAALVGAFLALSGWACGKKGPPLPPLIVLPAAVTELGATRVGDEVRLTFTVPSLNHDGSRPADLDRVEIYAINGPRAAGIPFLKQASLVGTLDIQLPQTQDRELNLKKTDKANGAGALQQGSRGLFVDRLEGLVKATPGVASAEPAAIREYVVFPVNRRGRLGSPSSPVIVSLGPAPPSPGSVEISFTAESIELSWPPLTRTTRPVQEAASGDVLPSTPIPRPPPPFRYNVYPAADGQVSPAVPPLHAEPLAQPTFRDPAVQFGTERCYSIRTVEHAQGLAPVESADSAPVCVVPIDIFPPAAPRNLAAVGTSGAVNLIWEPSPETDLDGYIVLRAEAAAELLRPITLEPIREATYRDTTVQTGIRYVYAVVAVDRAKPPNMSSQSNRVEETAR